MSEIDKRFEVELARTRMAYIQTWRGEVVKRTESGKKGGVEGRGDQERKKACKRDTMVARAAKKKMRRKKEEEERPKIGG